MAIFCSLRSPSSFHHAHRTLSSSSLQLPPFTQFVKSRGGEGEGERGSCLGITESDIPKCRVLPNRRSKNLHSSSSFSHFLITISRRRGGGGGKVPQRNFSHLSVSLSDLLLYVTLFFFSPVPLFFTATTCVLLISTLLFLLLLFLPPMAT